MEQMTAKLLIVLGLLTFLGMVAFFERYPKLLTYMTFGFITGCTALFTWHLLLS